MQISAVQFFPAPDKTAWNGEDPLSTMKKKIEKAKIEKHKYACKVKWETITNGEKIAFLKILQQFK